MYGPRQESRERVKGEEIFRNYITPVEKEPDKDIVVFLHPPLNRMVKNFPLCKIVYIKWVEVSHSYVTYYELKFLHNDST